MCVSVTHQFCKSIVEAIHNVLQGTDKPYRRIMSTPRLFIDNNITIVGINTDTCGK
jgi:hypothetical protein